MGCEICKLEEKEVFVLYDNTSGVVLNFHDFDTLLIAVKQLGRDMKKSFNMKDLIYKFEEEVCWDWDTYKDKWDEDYGLVNDEIKKIKDYWSKK